MSSNRTKLAAHTLLDMISVQDFAEAVADETRVATQAAFERLNEIDAVIATRDDETEVTTLDVSALLGGAGVLVSMLLTWIAEQGPYDRHDVIVAMRHVIDDLRLEETEPTGRS